MGDTLFAGVKKVIEEKIKPALNLHGGDVEIVEVTDDGILRVKLTGACAGCPAATATLKMFVERIVRQNVPEIKSVESVVDGCQGIGG